MLPTNLVGLLRRGFARMSVVSIGYRRKKKSLHSNEQDRPRLILHKKSPCIYW